MPLDVKVSEMAERALCNEPRQQLVLEALRI